MGLSEYDRILIKVKKKFKSHGGKRMFMNFSQKKNVKTILDKF